MSGKPVVLVEHDPEWSAAYEEEAGRLRLILGPALLAVHHVGSTAVPGLLAKPVLDVLVEATSLEDLDSRRAGFEEAGYRWRGEHGIAGRRYVDRDAPGWPMENCHVHMFALGHFEIPNILNFRDALRASSELASAYAALKRDLQARFPHDRKAYTDGKAAFIARVLDSPDRPGP